MARYNWTKIVLKLIGVIALAIGSKGGTLLSAGVLPAYWKLAITFEVLVNFGTFLLGLFTNANADNNTPAKETGQN